MPHWAQINDENVVQQVLRTEDADFPPATDEETSEDCQQAWLADTFGGTWLRTYYATEGRTYAGIGWTWDPMLGDFVAPPEPDPEVPTS
jgi:hypothetical protein